MFNSDPLNDNSENFYQQRTECYSQAILFASNLLEKCNYHGYNSLDLKSSNFNTYLYNIDGKKSNFDTFISEIVPFDGKFSVIGIAETNINSDRKDLYKIDEYNSFYSDKIPDKSKGTGVAIYVHDSFNSTFYSQASTNLPQINQNSSKR